MEQDPHSEPPVDRAAALEKIKLPATLVIVHGILAIVLGIVGAAGLMPSQELSEDEMAEMDESQREMMDKIQSFSAGGNMVGGILGIALGALITFGGLKLKNLENRGLAMTASILAIVPCFGCCVLGIPAGIWALIAMSKPEVKAAWS